MITETYTNVESEILNIISINDSPLKLDEILEKTTLGEHTVLSVLTNLVTKKILKFDGEKYIYQIASKNKKLILNGNLLLPVTIIRRDGFTFICRGKWYKISGEDFDVSRIVWNTVMNLSGEKSTLVELIEQQLLSTPNIKVTQLPEYKQLQNKKIIYNNNLDILVKVVGKENTKINICFKEKVYDTEGDKLNNNLSYDFTVMEIPAIINTDMLLSYLKPTEENAPKIEIELPKLITISDIIFNGNTFPISYDKKTVTFYSIEKNKHKMVLTKKVIDFNGVEIELDSDTYDNLEYGTDFVSSNLEYAREMVLKSGIILEE